MRTLVSMLSIVLVLALASTAVAEVITLKDGTVLTGKVLEGDEKGLRLQRFDTGGVIFLPWRFINDRDADRIRKDRGLDLGELDFLEIPGTRIELTDRTVIEGVVLERTNDRVVIQTDNRKMPIPLKRIVREEETTVNAAEVYPGEKLYEDQVAKGAPETASDHFGLAKFCYQIELYEKAIEHFVKVQELEAEFKPDFVRARINECEALLKNKAIAQLFNRITRLGYARKYTDALQTIEQMKEAPELDEVWQAKLKEKEAELKEAREKFLVRSIGSMMPPMIRSLANKASKDRNMTLQDARRYASRDFARDLEARIMKRLDLEQKEARDFIGKVKSFSVLKVSYGAFTWFAKGEKPPTFRKRQTNNNDNRGRRGRNNRQANEKKEQLPKADELWASSIAKQREAFIHATFVERAREAHVMKIERRTCGTCGGRGTVRSTGTGGIIETRCPRCRGIGTDRVVVYRVGPGDGKGNVATENSSREGLSPAERLRQRLLERRKQREERGDGGGDNRRGGRGGSRGGRGR